MSTPTGQTDDPKAVTELAVGGMNERQFEAAGLPVRESATDHGKDEAHGGSGGSLPQRTGRHQRVCGFVESVPRGLPAGCPEREPTAGAIRRDRSLRNSAARDVILGRIRLPATRGPEDEPARTQTWEDSAPRAQVMPWWRNLHPATTMESPVELERSPG